MRPIYQKKKKKKKNSNGNLGVLDELSFSDSCEGVGSHVLGLKIEQVCGEWTVDVVGGCVILGISVR